jgi:predicted amidohydrolase YtcJ
MSLRINNCFDSHVHWLGTGQYESILDLSTLTSPEDLRKVKVEPHHYCGDWIVGGKWDQNNWNEKVFPTKDILDELFPNNPVCFYRVDGHALWTNSEALKRAGLLIEDLPAVSGGEFTLGTDKLPAGVLIDNTMPLISKHVPEESDLTRYLLLANKIFNQSGITHIRDMSCSTNQWNNSLKIDDQLTLAVQQYFACENPHDFQATFEQAMLARKDGPKNIKLAGLKTYYDGALGSEGAYLSTPYLSRKTKGLKLLDDRLLRDIIKLAWSNDFEFAIHVIGDLAVHNVLKAAVTVQESGVKGVINLEHAEIFQPSDIELAKKLNIRFHMQPCHWNTDKLWMKEKIGELYQHSFHWDLVEKNNLPLFFGSDSPIEPPSLFQNKIAIDDHHNQLEKPFFQYHSHPNKSWTPETYTIFNEKTWRPEKVIFRGKQVQIHEE